jgi:3-methyladenine DNA glycosylase AlkD
MRKEKQFKDVLNALKKKADPKRAYISSGFFKTGKSQYGEGDVFIGVIVPEQRIIAKEYSSLYYSDCFSLSEISKLLENKIHECRLTALLILVYIVKDKKATQKIRKTMYTFYLKHVEFVNNWDLVDVSARDIVGAYLHEYDIHHALSILTKFAKSKHLWTKRISIISTFYFINQNSLSLTYTISDLLLKDSHDLIHKAVGWMLREAGKKDEDLLKEYLWRRKDNMPRTTLRYAIEKFTEKERKSFLA